MPCGRSTRREVYPTERKSKSMPSGKKKRGRPRKILKPGNPITTSTSTLECDPGTVVQAPPRVGQLKQVPYLQIIKMLEEPDVKSVENSKWPA